MTKKRTGGMAWRHVMEHLTESQYEDNEQLSEALKLIISENTEEAAEIIHKLTKNGQLRMRVLALLSANGINEVERLLFQIEPPNGKGKGD